MLFEKLEGDIVPMFHCGDNVEVEFDDTVDVVDDDVFGPIARGNIRFTDREVWISLENIPKIFLAHLSLNDLEKYKAIQECKTATLN